MEKASSQNKFFANLLSGVIAAILIISMSVCAASFIFSGGLAPFLPTGIGIALISSIVIGAFLAIEGSYYATIASVAIVPATLIGLMVQSIFKSVGDLGSILNHFDSLLPTILVSIILVTMGTGLFFYLMGRFRLGGLVRFVPYPVMGGFLAGVGWLIVVGSLNVMRRVPIPVDHPFDYFFNAPTLLHIIPGVIFAVVLLTIYHYVRHYLVLPAMIVAAIGVFYAALFLRGGSLVEAVKNGWLIEPFSTQMVWNSYNFSGFSQVNWDVIFSHFPDMVVILCVSIMAMLLTAAGIESKVDHEIDLDADLRHAGQGNLFAGVLGGIIGYHNIFFTRANHEAGATNRVPGLIAVLLCGLVAVFGAGTIVYYFPKPILGGLLLFFGVRLLIEWLYDSWFKVSRVEYALIVIIFISFIKVGFLQGLLLGVVLSAILFVIRYSRISIVKHLFSGDVKLSNVERSVQEFEILHHHGSQTSVVVLQGYIFFGTAHGLYNLVKHRLNDADLVDAKNLLFDFRLVEGLDSSACYSFIKIKKIIEKSDAKMILTAVPDLVKKQLLFSGCISEQDLVFDDLEQGIEWCEENIIREQEVGKSVSHTIEQLLADWFGDKAVAHSFIPYLQEKKLKAGQYLFKQGDQGDSIHIMEKGRAFIYLEDRMGRKVPLKKIKEGAIVGEMAVVRGVKRSASLIAEEDSTFYYLSTKNLERMKLDNPNLAIAFLESIAGRLSDRLDYSNKLISELG